MKNKIIIIGGGIAGLSAAHFLCDYPDYEIILYEEFFQFSKSVNKKCGYQPIL
jgi:glycine/D-amino acid oxidase-like deaminating enzyme